MALMIDAEMLVLRLKAIREFYGTNTAKDRAGRGGVVACICAVNEFPKIDAEPIRNGRWIKTNRFGETFVCSACEEVYSHRGAEKYCPYCGARMDGGVKE